MTIKNRGGIFGRNPSFNNITIDNNVTLNDATINGDTVFNSTPEIVGATNVSDGSNRPTLRLKSTSEGGWTSNTEHGSIEFHSDDDTSGAGIRAKISASTGGTNGSRGQLEFYTRKNDGTLNKSLRISEFGDLHLTGADRGSIYFSSGQGIDFSATSGTGTSELFDDYEEGLWTPVYQTTGTPFDAITHSIQNGFYRKVGNLVVVNFFLRTSSVTVGSATGLVVVGGLPYTPANTVGPGGAVVNTFGWGVNAPRAVRASPLGILYLSYNSLASRTTDVSTSDIGAATYNDCYATCIYYT